MVKLFLDEILRREYNLIRNLAGKGEFNMAGDLHCHTKLSDGSLGIEGLISLAQRIKLDTIAITDHDTLAGTTRGVLIGKRYGVRVIPGIEFSTVDEKTGKKAHLLAYLCETPDRLEGLCNRILSARKMAGQIMIARAMKRFPLTSEHVLKCGLGSTSIYKQHITRALMDLGYTDKVYGELFYELFTRGSEKNIVSEIKYPDIRKVLAEIHNAGGIAVLAHPGYYGNFDILDELMALGLDGVEVWHPRNSPDDTERLLQIANSHGLLKTGGTDFHGMNAAHPMPLGSFTTPDDCLEELLNYKDKKRKHHK